MASTGEVLQGKHLYSRPFSYVRRRGDGTERTSNVAQVAVGCVLAYGIVFYGVKGQGYESYCLRRRTRATLNSVSAQYCFIVFAVTCRLVVFTTLPKMIDRRKDKIFEDRESSTLRLSSCL